MSAPRRRWLAALAAIVAFGAVSCLCLLAYPYALGGLYGCVPPTGSCGDGVGWAMLIAAPIALPLTIVLAGGTAVAVYVRLARAPPP